MPCFGLATRTTGIVLLAGGLMTGAAWAQPTGAAPPAAPPLSLGRLTWTPAPEPGSAGTPGLGPLFGVDTLLTCPGCPGDATAPPSAPNAPWTMRGTWGVRGRAGSLSASLVGRRGASVPLYLQGPIDAAARVTPSSWVTMGDTRTSWDVVLRGERTLERFTGGQTISLFGEWFVPLGAAGSAVAGDVPALSQSAVLVGVRIRW